MHRIPDDDLRKYLKEQPEDPSLYNELSKEWDLADGDTNLTPGVREEMHSAITDAVRLRRQGLRRIYLRWTAAAAVLLIGFGGYQWWGHSATSNQPVQANRTIRPATIAENNTLDTLNSSGKAITLILSDGSQVTLYPKSRLHYFRNVAAVNKREMHLDGKAFFEVAKNREKAFTVYTGTISTTALGTSFSVVNQSSRIEVRLYTGKVALKKEQTTLPGWEKDLFLAPGERMLYDGLRSTVKVDREDTKSRAMDVASEDPGDFVSIDSSNSWVFRNAPLDNVLNKLQTGFTIAIDYQSRELNGMRFTGTVRPSDPPAVVLNMIANLNGLKITKTSAGFKVEKIN
jgi:ferric-dicitrate binding protein FerR (iron transport regulator)